MSSGVPALPPPGPAPVEWLKSGRYVTLVPIMSPSVAILLYLSRKYEAPDHWYPQDLQARARVDEYLAWQHTTLRSCCTRAMWQKVSHGEMGPLPGCSRDSAFCFKNLVKI